MAHRKFRWASLSLSSLPLFAISLFAIGCGDSVDVGADEQDTGVIDAPADGDGGVGEGGEETGDGGLDTGPLDTGPLDTGPVDTGPPLTGCAAEPLAVDPASTLDPLKDGGIAVGHHTFVVPKLGPLSDVKVRATYPALADKTTPHPGRHAWVMFHHAVHCDTTPCTGVVYDEYDGIFDRWASHGFVIFSIDGAKIFFPTPSGSGLSWKQQLTVSTLMDQAITYFLDQQENSAFELKCALDPSRLAVSGHSRGGGAALLVPTTRTDKAKIKAYVGFQPIDPEITAGAPFPATVPEFDGPALWLDSTLDGDVIYPINAMQYGHTRESATLVSILGSKHTFTLDKPLPDQGGPTATITPDEHRRVCHQYALPFLRARVRDATPSAADLDRFSGPTGMSVDTAVSSGNVNLSWRQGSAFGYLEKFDEDLGTTPSKTVAGDSITLEGAMTAVSYETFASTLGGFGAETFPVSKVIRSCKLNWGGGDSAINIPLPAGALTGKKAIVFETAWLNSPTTTSGVHPLFLELTDSTGAKSTLAIKDLVGPAWSLRPRRLSEVYAPLTKFTGVDLAKAKAVRIVSKAGTPNEDILIDVLRVE